MCILESLAKIGQQNKRVDTYDLLEDINTKLIELEKNQIYQLSEQEKLYYKTLTMEELIKVMANNLQDMKKNVDILIEKWGDK